MSYALEVLNTIVSLLLLSGAAAFLIPVFREFIGKLLASVLQLNIDKRLEEFKAEIRATEQRLNAIASVALSTLSGRQNALSARQLQAVEELWENKATLDALKGVAMTMSAIDLDVAARRIRERNQPMLQFFQILQSNSLERIQQAESKIGALVSEQPFLSPTAWAIYAAYVNVLMCSVARLRLFATAVPDLELIDEKTANALLTAALPKQTSDIAKYNVAGRYRFLDPLEQRLIEECQHFMSGEATDKATVDRAKKLYEPATRTLATPPSTPKIPEELKRAAD